ncbi:hypothetical protein SHK09_10245 [Polaribacter sp. PL03]|uniref:hypothetical protein n=1 Tax=Polaribacter sp. PL03 TaxID=3088353 RepID=UPI0029CBDB9B|nr:hypothetical protein [Polaribacter sp. PL03]MDX6747171.1 hypothetical protein [Polaribacter sp. PL03]
MNKKYFYLFFCAFLLSLSLNAINIDVKRVYSSFIEVKHQDKTVMIRKIKAKINALEKQRERLKIINRWSNSKEKSYLLKIDKLKSSLDKLGENSNKNLNVDEIIKKLQKQLKFLNNARVNKNTKNTWSKVDDSIYKKDAAVLLDSIIKLRIKVN